MEHDAEDDEQHADAHEQSREVERLRPAGEARRSCRRVASRDTPRSQKPQAEAQANRLGIVVAELTPEQKKESRVQNGVMVTEVRPDARADVRKGDIITTVVHRGQHTELRSAEQFNKLLAGLDKNAVLTLQVRRGENIAFVTVSGLTDKG